MDDPEARFANEVHGLSYAITDAATDEQVRKVLEGGHPEVSPDWPCV
jgi:hypothetical protein